jgi:diacylglycerol kinase (ATP)
MRPRKRIVTIARLPLPTEHRLRSAILTNPHSSRNRRHLPRLRDLLRKHADIRHIETASVDDLQSVVDSLLADRVELVCINGGDGTVHLVLSALLRASAGQPLPTLALLPGGTTNMSARDINGGSLSLWRALDALLAVAAGHPATAPRYLLHVHGTGAEPQLGLCLGMGAVVRGIEYCHERIFSLGIREEWATGVALLRAGWGIARREPVFAEGVPLDISIDGEQHRARAAIFLISALSELMLGIRPFWGDGVQPLRVTLVREHAGRFMRSFPDLLRGRPDPHLTEAAGYLSRRGGTIEVVGNCPYTIDGEIYHASTNRIRVDAFGPVNIVPLGGMA